MNIADTYTLAQRDIANFVAYLKNSATYEDDDKIFLVNRETLNEKINQLISERKFGGSSELVNYAKNEFENTDMISAETSLQFVDIPFSSYYKLAIIAERGNLSLDDILRKLTIPKLKSSLEEIKQFHDVDKKKTEQLSVILKEWENKRNGTECVLNLISDDDQRCYGNGGKYSIKLSNEITSKLTFQVDTMFVKHLELLLNTVFSKHKIPDTIASLCVKSRHFLLFPVNIIGINGKSLNFSFYINYLPSNYSKFLENLQNDILDQYGVEISNKVGSAVNEYPLDHFLTSFGTYGIDINTGQFLIEGVNPLNRSVFEKMVYDKLINECSLSLCGDGKNESISLIESDFDENVYTQKLQSAISNDDYEAASMYGESLHIHQVLVEMVPEMCDVLNEVINLTKKVTFKMPDTLWTMLNLALDEKSFDVFIGEELDRYWDGGVVLG